MVRLTILLSSLRGRLWVIPAMGALLAAVAAWVAVAVDRSIAAGAEAPFLFAGGPESARAILSTIAAAMLTFTGLVFSVTMLVLQLASSQLSPRVATTFMRDRRNQLVLAVFVATLVYALLVLATVRSDAEETFVPALAVWLAIVLLLASIGAFIFYIDHMARTMQVATVIRRVAGDTRDAIGRTYPDPDRVVVPSTSQLPRVTQSIAAPDDPGVIQAIDTDRLIELARRAGAVLEVTHAIGDAVVGGESLVLARGATIEDEDAVRAAIAIGPERTIEQDPAFGFRQLVDIGVRALSPAVNDPTTAHQVVDMLHDLLRRLGGRAIPGPERPDGDGATRLILAVRTWDDYVALACEELRLACDGSVQVARALRRMLDELETVVRDERRPALRRERAMLPAEDG